MAMTGVGFRHQGKLLQGSRETTISVLENTRVRQPVPLHTPLHSRLVVHHPTLLADLLLLSIRKETLSFLVRQLRAVSVTKSQSIDKSPSSDLESVLRLDQLPRLCHAHQHARLPIGEIAHHPRANESLPATAALPILGRIIRSLLPHNAMAKHVLPTIAPPLATITPENQYPHPLAHHPLPSQCRPTIAPAVHPF